MGSKRRHEGYLLIDNRNAPPVEPLQGFGENFQGIGGGQTFESATITCHHCHAVVILNPARDRARNYCPKCDHYICDACEQRRAASGGECVPMNKVLDTLQEETYRNEQRGTPIVIAKR